MDAETDLDENFDDEFYDDSNYELDEYEGKKQNIENRLECLKKSMTNLKDEIKLEKELWEKETHIFYESKRKKSDEQVNAEKQENKFRRLPVEPSLTDPSLLDYEKKLSMYHEALVRSHIEKRVQLRKHLIADAYKKRLIEIENMCNVELLKVKQSVQNLQPLQAIASQWKLDEEITGGSNDKKSNSDSKDREPKETMSVTSECKQYQDIKDILVYNSPTRSSLATASSFVQEDEDDMLMMRRLQSMGWYNNEINYLGFHPYF